MHKTRREVNDVIINEVLQNGTADIPAADLKIIKTTATGRIDMFSELAYCAVCGAKLSFCAAKSLNSNQQHYRCSNYKSNRDQCQVHYIGELLLQKIVLKAIQDLAVFVQEFEPVFLYLMDQKSSKEQKQEIARLDQVIQNSKTTQQSA